MGQSLSTNISRVDKDSHNKAIVDLQLFGKTDVDQQSGDYAHPL